MNICKTLIFLFSVSSIFCSQQDYRLKINKEIDHLKKSNFLYEALITESDAPYLKNVIDKCIRRFSDKAGIDEAPSVFINCNPENYECYDFFYSEYLKGILIGDRLLGILFSNKVFEKYFSAMFAHEYGHFFLKHRCPPELEKEIEADKFALSVADKPIDLLEAQIFRFICIFLIRTMIESFKFDNYTAEQNSAKIMLDILALNQGLKMFYNAKSWKDVNDILRATLLEVRKDKLVDTFAFCLERKVNQVLYNKSWASWFWEYLESDIKSGTGELHPSPKYLKKLC